jgi:hypothetical protein
MLEMRRLFIDRRSGEDRRKVYDLDYFLNGGIERRSWKERRSQVERRGDWLRVDEWVSVLVGGLKDSKVFDLKFQYTNKSMGSHSRLLLAFFIEGVTI